MKYGETLQQRSIPEWFYHNINYDEIKHLIKEKTSPGKSKAVSIPGQGHDAEREFEKVLFAILSKEHEHITLFVKSKSLEIQRRLGTIDQRVRQLQLRNRSGVVKDVQYARLEQEAIKAGEEIQSLARFINAQKLAFIKLMKKYKKWSGSNAVKIRFESEVMSKSDSFTKVFLSDQVDDWSDALQAIRLARSSASTITPAGTSKLDSPPSRFKPSAPRERSTLVAGQLGAAVASRSGLDFDAAFTDVPIGESGAKAVYWIHQDQLIELQVVLLQHLCLFVPEPAVGGSSSLPQTPTASPRRSLSRTKSQFGQVEVGHDFGAIVLDHVEDYAYRQSRSTVSDSEDSRGQSSAAPAAIARWTTTNEASLSLRLVEDTLGSMKVKKRHLSALLDPDAEVVPLKSSGSGNDTGRPAKVSRKNVLTPNTVRELLKKHREIQPLVGLFSKRSRFVGFLNSPLAGQWCTLDSNISISKLFQGDVVGDDWAAKIGRKSTSFPYAVLEVRQEGSVAKDIIEILDRSHLTERVRGFSLVSHAIWECHKPKNMSPPFWLPVLARDIRKVPEAVPRIRRKGSEITVTRNHTSTGSNENETGSSTAVATGESSVTSVPTTPIESRDFNSAIPPKKQRRVTYHQDALLKKEAKRASLIKAPRYWSEYDHPEDGSGDENAYYLYVDPNASDAYPGQETIEKVYGKLKGIFRRQKARHEDEESPSILTPLLDHDIASSPADSDSDSRKAQTPKIKSYGAAAHGTSRRNTSSNATGFGTDNAGSTPSPSPQRRLLTTTICLAVSAIISVGVGIFASTSHKRIREQVDVGVLLGIITSLAFAFAGMTSAVAGREHMNLTAWLIFTTIFIAVCIANGALIGFVL